ncbi:MAG: protoglobin domain-containing protein [Myxococcaceae bacterium]|jgi:signal transduction histidine kinase|nr:protoglobin domain-containing protein [Myxococcaceae bacterium]
MQRLFGELKRYVGFSADDERRLRTLHPRVLPHFERTIERFYGRILEHDDARAALERGERRVGHLKVTLLQWMEELFLGPWDEAYVDRRARIGTTHVRISLPQHYMVTAMSMVRSDLLDVLDAPDFGDDDRHSVQRVLDLDLAIMLHTYRLDLEARQARAERLATFGQLVGSIGHELRNPLGVIETSLYVLKSKVDGDPRVSKHLDRISHQVTLANDIITQLLDLIRDKPLGRQKVDLGRIFLEVAQAVTRPEGVQIELPTYPTAPVSGDPVQLRQVVMNLVENAVHAASPQGRVVIGAARVGQSVDVTVDDTGPGIDPSIGGRLFEPLMTTKAKGIGLGLALVKRIVDRHGGMIEASKSPLGGARFTVRLQEAS